MKNTESQENDTFNAITQLLLNLISDSVKPINPLDGELRDAWIRRTIEKLLSEINSKELINLHFKETDLPDFYQKTLRLRTKGKLVFDDDKWIIMKSNSKHDDPEIGDITVAICSDGRAFINEGHVCGGIINFITNQKVLVTDADHFFQHFTSDTDQMSWTIFYDK